ncbi:MAG TPA: HD domain-containing phosphohydrolase [Ardenticatenaceae bacterium]|nr:HD domain-containing phosphohydrolase [Ardenticatenaceae bacterium]
MKLQQLRVLLVEDDEEDYLLTRALLAEGGINPRLDWVASYESAVETLRGAQHDVYLLDYCLGTRTGLDLLREAMANDCAAPIIMLTGQGDYTSSVEAMRAGAADYLPKDQLNAPLLERSIRYALERKQAEVMVQQSEAQFRAIFEHAAIGITVTDMRGRYVKCNPAFEAMLGYTEHELRGMRFAHITHPADVDADVPLFRELVAGERDSYQLDKRYIRKDGTGIWAHLVVSLVRDAKGAAQFVMAMVENVTARKRAEEAEVEQRVLAEALRDTAEALNTTLDLNELLDRILANVGRVVPHDGSNIILLEASGARVARSRGYGQNGRATLRLERSFQVANFAALDEMVTTGCTVLIPDTHARPDWVALPETGWIRSYVAAPLRVKGEVIGFLNLDSAIAGFFTPTHAGRLQAFADQAATALENARLLGQTERRLQRITALRSIDMAIEGSLDLRLSLGVVIEQVTSHLGVDAAAIFLLNPFSKMLEYAAGRGFRSSAITRSSLRLGEGFAGRVALERRRLCIADLRAAGQDFVRWPPLAREGFDAYFGVPLIVKGRVEGVLEVFHRTPLDPDPEWTEFLEILAGQAAIAIDNARLFEGLQRSNLELGLAYDATIEGWSRALDLRDKETEGHSRRVTEMTVHLARSMGMHEAELQAARWGALLHDIGKMGVPDHILLKPGKLTDEEWEIMRRHPVFAYELLSSISFLRSALDIPYCHHEKWDGTGYPRGLKGEQIPLAARIFAVVDVWDALRSDRPYRAAWPAEKALAHIRSLAGTHFDPAVVEAFLALVEGLLVAQPQGAVEGLGLSGNGGSAVSRQ